MKTQICRLRWAPRIDENSDLGGSRSLQMNDYDEHKNMVRGLMLTVAATRGHPTRPGVHRVVIKRKEILIK